MNRVLIAYLALRLLCALLGVAGVFVLLGQGWSLIAAAVFTLEIAETIRRGMSARAMAASMGQPGADDE